MFKELLKKTMICIMVTLLILNSTLTVVLATDQGTASYQGVSPIPNNNFTWDNVVMYSLLTDRFSNGNESNDHSYNRGLNADGTVADYNDVAAFQGGDFKGITQKIEAGYFNDLGVNAICVSGWFEQIHGYTVGSDGKKSFPHYAYHGYYALDFTELDQNYGTEVEFKEMIDTAHEHGIRIVLDVVLNHPGYNTIYDMNEYNFGTLKSGWQNVYYNFSSINQSNYHSVINYNTSVADWSKWWGSNWIRGGLAGYDINGSDELTGSVNYLPDFKTESTSIVDIPEVLKTKWTKEGTYTTKVEEIDKTFSDYRLGDKTVTNYLVAWYAKWVEEYGIDGFKCDTAKYVDISSWKKLSETCTEALENWRTSNPDAIGADWNEEFWMTGENYGQGVSYNQYYQNGFDSMINFSFSGDDQGNNCNGVPGASSINSTYASYASQINSNSNFNVLTYISSHNTGLCRDNLIYQGSALLLIPGGVQIFYGDETNREYVECVVHDHENRGFMNWSAIDEEVLSHWQIVGSFRNNHIAVGAGSHTNLTATSGTAFARTYNKGGVSDKVACVIGANNNTNVTITLNNTFADGTVVHNAYDGAMATVTNGKVTFNSGDHGTILVDTVALTGIYVTTLPNNLAYLEGKDELDTTGGKITLYYNDNTTKVVDLTADMVSGFNNSKVGEQTLIVTYNGKSTTYDIEIIAKSLVSIEVSKLPQKLTYLEEKDKLDTTGGKIKLYYNNDTSEVIDITADMVFGFDNTIVGEQTLTIIYNNYIETYDIEVIAKNLDSIEVSKLPRKLIYLEAKDNLNTAEGKLTLYYNNDTLEEVDLKSDMVSGFDNAIVGEQTLTVTYNGKSTTYNVEIIAKSLVSIEVSKLPQKLTYLEGKDELDTTGGEITLYYNNDTSEVTDITADMVSGFDNAIVGEQTLTVTYNGKSTTYNVEVIAKELESIEITKLPRKLAYLEKKDELDTMGGKIKLYYNNDTSEVKDITADMVSGFDNAIVGDQTLTVAYGGKSTTYNIEVIAKELESIEVSKLPEKLTYLEKKDELDTTGGKITLYYNNDTTEDIDITVDMISGFDNTIVGKQSLTVTYSGKIATYDIEIIAKILESIEVVSLPDKTEYLQGEAFNSQGMVVIAKYSNAPSGIITDYSCDDTVGMDPGKMSFMIEYGEVSTLIEITVKEKPIKSISISQMPYKTVYMQGEAFDPDGIVIEVTYTDGTTYQTSKCTVIDTNTLEEGLKDVTVIYNGKYLTFEMVVIARALDSVEITKTPDKLNYDLGEKLDLTGMIVTAFYANGDLGTTTDYVVDYDKNATGIVDVTVSFMDKTATFAIYVDNPNATDPTAEPTEPSTGDDTKPSDTTGPSIGDDTKPSEPVVDKEILGDVNGDSKVNIKDATLIQKVAAKIIEMTEHEKLRADVNADAKINIKDATAIQKYCAKYQIEYPIGEYIKYPSEEIPESKPSEPATEKVSESKPMEPATEKVSESKPMEPTTEEASESKPTDPIVDDENTAIVGCNDREYTVKVGEAFTYELLLNAEEVFEYLQGEILFSSNLRLVDAKSTDPSLSDSYELDAAKHCPELYKHKTNEETTVIGLTINPDGGVVIFVASDVYGFDFSSEKVAVTLEFELVSSEEPAYIDAIISYMGCEGGIEYFSDGVKISEGVSVNPVIIA